MNCSAGLCGRLSQVSRKHTFGGRLPFISALVSAASRDVSRRLEICFCALFNCADKSLGSAFIEICERRWSGEIFVGKTYYLAALQMLIKLLE